MLSKTEIKRQLFHLVLGLALAGLYYLDIIGPLTMFLGIICGGLLSFISKRVDIPIFSTFLDHFERKEVRNKFPGKGMIFYFIGTLFVMQLFEKDIALAAIMILAFGDSVSHLFGARFGKIKNIISGDSQKLLEGTFAGTVAGALSAALFVPFPEAFLGALAAMIFEVFKIDFNDKTLDDNIVVPLIAGTVMFLIRTYL
jgi:dolichol kinase